MSSGIFCLYRIFFLQYFLFWICQPWCFRSYCCFVQRCCNLVWKAHFSINTDYLLGMQEGAAKWQHGNSASVLTITTAIQMPMYQNKAWGLCCITCHWLLVITYLEMFFVATWRLCLSLNSYQNLFLQMKAADFPPEQRGGYLTFVCWLICLRNLT